MRRTIQLAGGIETLFGTLDENLKLLESTLRVTTQLEDDHLAIDGEPAQVDRAVRILDEYNQLFREGRNMSSADVKAMIRVATEDPKAFAPQEPRASDSDARACIWQEVGYARRVQTSASTWKRSSSTTWSSPWGPAVLGRLTLP